MQLFAPGPKRTTALTQDRLPHVLLVVDGFPKALGGGERIVLRTAALLPQYGFRASILTFAVHPESSFRSADAPCPVYLLPLTNTYGPGAWRAALALRRFLVAQQVRIAQTFFESSDLWAGTVTRLLSPAKLVWSRRDMGILRGTKHRIAYRLLRRLPHAVFAVSAKVAEHVAADDGVPPHRIHVIYNGFDPSAEVHAAVGASSASKVVTTIGNVRRVNGHDLFIEAAAQVASALPEVTFTVAGEVLEPEYFAALQEQVAALGLSGKFLFLGKVEDLASHLSRAKIFVLPSRSAGFSNALSAAMSFCLSCVSTDVGGNAEAIRHGASGLIVPPENASALAQSILCLLTDPALADHLALGALARVRAEFSTDAMMRKVTETYKSLLSLR